MPETMSQDQVDETTTVLMQVGNQRLELTRLTWGDVTDFEEHLRATRLNMFYDHIGDYSPGAQAQITLSLMRLPFSTQDVFDNMSSPAGMQWVLLRALKTKQPQITLDELNLPLTEILKLSTQLLAISGLIKLDAKGNPIPATAKGKPGEADTPAT